MFSTATWVLIGAALSGAMADDVYTIFSGPIGVFDGPNYDISNDGCFSVGNKNARTVAFESQSKNGDFDGPYCLSAWAESGCNGDARATQQFQDLKNPNGGIPLVTLSDGVANAGSYKWSAVGC